MALTRREFLKGAAAGAATVAAMSVAPAFANSAAPELKTWSWDTKPEPIDESKVIETIECEMLVLGAGFAGTSAACSAKENGVDVVVVEKSPMVNGRGGGVGACNSRLHKEKGIEIDAVAAQYRWNRTCGNRTNEALVKLWFDKTGPAMDWLLDKADKRGATYNLYAGYSYSKIAPEEPDFHTFSLNGLELPEECSSFGPVALLYLDCKEMGVPFYFEHTAEQLIQDGDRVVGAYVSCADGYKKFMASKGVVLATGDIHGDPEMMDAYCEPMMKNTLKDEYTPVGVNTGDGHKMGMWAGAVMQDGPLPIALHPQACAWFHGPFMFVNAKGKRFFNEGTWVQAKSIQMLKQPGFYAYSIFDANYGADTKASLENGGGMFWDSMSRNVGQEFDPSMVSWAVDMAMYGGNGFQADTLEELAEQMKDVVDKDTFLAEVAHYNEMCEKGVDDDFAKEGCFMFPIKQGPFYALKVGPAILAVVGGLRVNTDLQCLNAEGEPIPGLYAIGNTSGDIYAVDYPINMPGNSHGRCLAWGWLVGQTIAAL